MKLIVAIAHNREQGRVADALIKAEIGFTKIGSTGGFLRNGSTTLMIGVDEADVERVLAILKNYCHKEEHIVAVTPYPTPALSAGSINPQPVIEETGGGIVFVLDVDRVERY